MLNFFISGQSVVYRDRNNNFNSNNNNNQYGPNVPQIQVAQQPQQQQFPTGFGGFYNGPQQNFAQQQPQPLMPEGPGAFANPFQPFLQQSFNSVKMETNFPIKFMLSSNLLVLWNEYKIVQKLGCRQFSYQYNLCNNSFFYPNIILLISAKKISGILGPTTTATAFCCPTTATPTTVSLHGCAPSGPNLV